MTSRRPACLLGLVALLSSPVALADRDARAADLHARAAERDPRAAGLGAKDAELDAQAAALVDRARARPADASAAAAELLLLDRDDDALRVLLDAGLHAEALDLLASGLRLSEALEVPVPQGDLAAQLARTRVLAIAGRRAEAVATLADLARRDERAAEQAVAEAARLGLRDELLGAAIEAAGSRPLVGARAIMLAPWPSHRLEAEAAWAWLRRESPTPSVADAMLRMRAILDPSQPSRDADEILAGGMAGLGNVGPCEQPRLHAGLVGLARLRGQNERALALARGWADATGSAAAWMTLGDVLRDREGSADLRGAAEAYGRAAAASREEGAALWLQAATLRELGEDAAALPLEAQAQARAEAGGGCARLRLAAAMAQVGDRDAAARLHEAVLRMPDADAGLLASVASALSRRAETPASLEAVASATGRARARVRAAAGPGAGGAGGALSVGRVLPLVRATQAAELRRLARTGDADAALELAEHALDAFVLDVDPAVEILSELRRQGRDQDADALHARLDERLVGAAEAFPESARLLNARAWWGARTRTGLEAARDAAERAVALAPQDAGILDTLGEVRFQQGDRAGAIEAERRALELEPDSRFFHLQVERFTSGDPASAPPLGAE